MGAVDMVAASEIDRLAREVQRLRAENVRLARLLELRGQDTRPGPEQLAVPTPALVTMASPVEDKLALYADRFRARTDVHAVRWENHRTGTAGWMPAVAGGWRKGMDRRHANHLPLTAQVVGSHLAGHTFVGLYPLLRDSTCHFLVADFDGPAAMLDALAYCKSARANGVPAALELSQSGRGAHVWVFFTDRIPAATARAVGTVLLHEAMVLRGSMDLRSYDRLFPNQDVLPEGGVGQPDCRTVAGPATPGRSDRLPRPGDSRTVRGPVGVPLHYGPAQPRRRATSLPPGQTGRRRQRRATMSRSEATKVHPPLPAVVHAELGAGLTLSLADLPAAAVSTFKHAASMANPKFYELQRLRKSTWDTPRFVRGYDITVDEHLVLPRGLRHTVMQIVERAGSRLAARGHGRAQPRQRDRRRLHRPAQA